MRNSATAAAPARIPRPSQIFDPVARALDLIGDRWTLVLVRQLLVGPKAFTELRQRTGIAPRVLSGRLRQLASDGFIQQVPVGTRSAYAVTPRGRSLEPILAALARWWTHEGIEESDVARFTETSPQSILESLPFLLREDRIQEEPVIFEIRLEGPGGGVWAVTIADGRCSVCRGFAERADVRYTADARAWCEVALGVLDAREAVSRGLMNKDGGAQALDHYFHRVSNLGRRTGTEAHQAFAQEDRN